MILPKILVLGGGGIRVSAIIGALQVLYKKNLLRKVKEVCGISAGAWLSFFIACEIPVETIAELILQIDFGIILNLTTEAFLNFPEVFGVDDGTKFEKFLESMFRVVLKINPFLTFSDLATLRSERPGILKFRCWAINIQTPTRIREFSEELTPSVRIIDAIRASAAIPFMFTPIKDPITGNLLVDGGIVSHLPFQYLTPDECNQSLGIGFSFKTDPTEYPEPTNFFEFMHAIIRCMKSTRAKELEDSWSHKICKIPVQGYPAWNFQASIEDKKMLLNIGKQTMETWILSEKHQSRYIQRRNSI